MRDVLYLRHEIETISEIYYFYKFNLYLRREEKKRRKRRVLSVFLRRPKRVSF